MPNWKRIGLVAGAGLLTLYLAGGRGCSFLPSREHKIDVQNLAGRDLYVLADSVDTERGRDLVSGKHLEGTDMLSVYTARWDQMQEVAKRYGETPREELPELMEQLQREGLVTRFVLTAPMTQAEYLGAAHNLADRKEFPVLRLNPRRMNDVRFNYRQTGRNPAAIGTDDVDKDGMNEVVVDVEGGLYFVREDTWETTELGDKSNLVRKGQYPGFIPETDAGAIGQSARDTMLRDGADAVRQLRENVGAARQRVEQRVNDYESAVGADVDEAQQWTHGKVWRFADQAVEAFEQGVVSDTQQAADSATSRVKKDYQNAAERWNANSGQ